MKVSIKKNRSTGHTQSIKLVNNDLKKYNGISKDSNKRKFFAIPPELFMLINNLQTDTIIPHPDRKQVFKKTKTKDVFKTIDVNLNLKSRTARYLLTVIGMSDGYGLSYPEMIKYTGMADSHVTEAKNDLIDKDFLLLDETKKVLTVNYPFLYQLYKLLDEDKLVDVLNQGAISYTKTGYSNVPDQDINISQTGISTYPNLVHIIDIDMIDNNIDNKKENTIIDNNISINVNDNNIVDIVANNNMLNDIDYLLMNKFDINESYLKKNFTELELLLVQYGCKYVFWGLQEIYSNTRRMTFQHDRHKINTIKSQLPGIIAKLKKQHLIQEEKSNKPLTEEQIAYFDDMEAFDSKMV